MVNETTILGAQNTEKGPNGTVYIALFPVEIQAQLDENLNSLATDDLVENIASHQDRIEHLNFKSTTLKLKARIVLSKLSHPDFLYN